MMEFEGNNKNRMINSRRYRGHSSYTVKDGGDYEPQDIGEIIAEAYPHGIYANVRNVDKEMAACPVSNINVVYPGDSVITSDKIGRYMPWKTHWKQELEEGKTWKDYGENYIQ